MLFEMCLSRVPSAAEFTASTLQFSQVASTYFIVLLHLHCKLWRFGNQVKSCYAIPTWQKKKKSLRAGQTSRHSEMSKECATSEVGFKPRKNPSCKMAIPKTLRYVCLTTFNANNPKKFRGLYSHQNTVSNGWNIRARFFSWSSSPVIQLGCAQ